ncbi:MAG TPA: hypothetical protein PKA05_21515 [Roseiflexaceae bacterium]|nr:hypothetical protein [Roseiflexaceae bacterium]
MIVLGAAYQRGLLPVRAVAIEQAIELNGVAVHMNCDAFRLGRMAVADPAWLDRAEAARRQPPSAPDLTPAARTLLESVAATGELRRLLELRIPELIAYQNESYAREYVEFVRRVAAAEQALGHGEQRLSCAVARYLFKLMAYKDEYEVARLSLAPALGQAIEQQFGVGARRNYQLHPPLMRALGWQHKIGFGSWFDTIYRLLVALRRLRGTPFDIFGMAHVRRVERALIGEYRQLIEQALIDLNPTNYERAVQLAELPDLIRGYETIKLTNIARFRAEVQALGFSVPDPVR